MKVDHGLFTSDVITLNMQDLVTLINGKQIEGYGKVIKVDGTISIEALKMLIDAAMLCSMPGQLKVREENNG